MKKLILAVFCAVVVSVVSSCSVKRGDVESSGVDSLNVDTTKVDTIMASSDTIC